MTAGIEQGGRQQGWRQVVDVARALDVSGCQPRVPEQPAGTTAKAVEPIGLVTHGDSAISDRLKLRGCCPDERRVGTAASACGPHDQGLQSSTVDVGQTGERCRKVTHEVVRKVEGHNTATSARSTVGCQRFLALSSRSLVAPV